MQLSIFCIHFPLLIGMDTFNVTMDGLLGLHVSMINKECANNV